MRGYLDKVTTLVKGFLDLVTIDSFSVRPRTSLMPKIVNKVFLHFCQIFGIYKLIP